MTSHSKKRWCSDVLEFTGNVGSRRTHPTGSRGSSAGWLLAGSPAAPWCRVPVCARRASELAAVPRDRDDGTFVVHDKSLTAHQHKQAAIAEATANRCKLAQPLPHSLITRSSGTIANRASIRAKCPTRPPFAHIETAAQMSDGLSPCGGRHHFFAATSFSMALSSIASASSFFSFAFSSSSAFSHFAFRKPLARRTWPSFVERRAQDPVLAADISGRRSRNIPMICSSVKRLGFMVYPSRLRGSDHNDCVLAQASMALQVNSVP
jgi:hypothetical protein